MFSDDSDLTVLRTIPTWRFTKLFSALLQLDYSSTLSLPTELFSILLQLPTLSCPTNYSTSGAQPRLLNFHQFISNPLFAQPQKRLTTSISTVQSKLINVGCPLSTTQPHFLKLCCSTRAVQPNPTQVQLDSSPMHSAPTQCNSSPTQIQLNSNPKNASRL